jgi:hypothetical protein
MNALSPPGAWTSGRRGSNRRQSSRVSGEMVEAGVPRRAGASRRVFTLLAGHLGNT